MLAYLCTVTAQIIFMGFFLCIFFPSSEEQKCIWNWRLHDTKLYNEADQ